MFDRVNHQGTRAVLDAALRHKVQRVILTSTMDVFATPPTGGTLVEGQVDTSPRASAYQTSKVAAELAGTEALAQGLDLVFLNPAAIYGPISPPTTLNATIDKLLRGQLPGLPPGGMSVVFSEGLAAAQLGAAERGKRGEHYLVADDHITPRRLAEVVEQVAGLSKLPRTLPAWLLRAVAATVTPVAQALGKETPVDPGQLAWLLADTHVDASKARRELGFLTTPIEAGVRQTVAFLRKGAAATG